MSPQTAQASITKYLADVKQQFDSGHAIEHAYRPALKNLMESFDDTLAVNDPKHSEHGAPDFVFLKASHASIIKGYAEAKDIGKPLDKVEQSDQMLRYAGYANLFLTDYLEFRFYKNGVKYQTLSLGKVHKGQLQFEPENGERLWRELNAFLALPPEKIKSGRRLAEIMGAKARRIRDDVVVYLADASDGTGDLTKIYQLMKTMLVHDLTPQKFADMYAQTLVYGLFVARYGDTTEENFTRAEARDLVPRSNPFLREFFDHIAGTGFDPRLAKIVDELCQVFSVSNIQDIVHQHLRIQDDVTDAKDPIIHFYEDFLRAYDPAQKKSMGAYYTPTPVVKFIVRSIDKILKQEFGITQGLASTETVQYSVDIGQDSSPDRRRKKDTTVTRTEPRVQILDPAVGTATFLNETVKHIHKTFKGQEGRWPAYVRDNLVKRLYGFELMMAPYTIAHLKLGMTLNETGVKDIDGRLNVFLTNTLEKGVPTQPDLFTFGLADAVSEESRLAAEVKAEKPVMVVLGNPPYSGISANETEYANSLVAKYKVEPGGNQKLRERKHWLNDDYVKFLAFAEDMIAKKGTGVVGMITNNGYIDNPTFRGMRWHLASTFDKIFVLDLHGSRWKLDRAASGTADENVFDIEQGVAIILAVKSAVKNNQLATIYHADCYGSRNDKFKYLDADAPDWVEVELGERLYFAPKDFAGKDEYFKGIPLPELMPLLSNAAASAKDRINFTFSVDEIRTNIEFIRDHEDEEIRAHFGIRDSRDWKASTARADVTANYSPTSISEFLYRPFDMRYTFYSGNSRGIYSSPQRNILQHLDGHNVAFLLNRKVEQQRPFTDIFVTSTKAQYHSLSIKETNSIAPLYVSGPLGMRVANFDQTKLAILTANVTVAYTPEDIFDYIYAVLHSPSYRKNFDNLLKDDFPRVPVIESDDELARLVRLGGALRLIHLMQSPALAETNTTYPIAGSDVVEQVNYKDGNVYINEHQYFGNVPKLAWDFYIGGYQPAQKWINDRKGRRLSDADLSHYQRIITALIETDRIMKEID